MQAQITEPGGPLARVEQAHRLLAQARSVDEVKGVRDQAAAAALYAKERGYSQEIIDYASEIKVRAERKAGALLAEIEREPRAGAGRPRKEIASTTESQLPTPYQETLTTANVSRQTAQRWQDMARVPEPVFEEAVSEVKADGRGLTSAAVMRTAEEKVQRKVMDTVLEAVPGAEERIARAKLKAVFSKAVADLRHNLLALDPSAVYAALGPADMPSLHAVMGDLTDWLDRMRAIDAQPVRAIK